MTEPLTYNAAFFGLYEHVFEVMAEERGQAIALDFLRKLFARALGKAYSSMGFLKGDPHEFARVVKERDIGVGLHVEFPVIESTRIVYQFHTDPFPNLKGKVAPHLLDDTYLGFKILFLLGDGWSYQTPKHIWKGDAYTEHVIERRV